MVVLIMHIGSCIKTGMYSKWIVQYTKITENIAYVGNFKISISKGPFTET